MTTNELFNLITSEPKWYAGNLSPQTATNIKRQHLDGTYKNYDWFFGLFGYEAKTEWVKKKDEYVIRWECGVFRGELLVDAQSMIGAKLEFFRLLKEEDFIPMEYRIKHLLVLEIQLEGKKHTTVISYEDYVNETL